MDDRLIRALRSVAPGTVLREGLEHILRARMGALIVVGDTPPVMSLVHGGFRVDSDLLPAYLYELAKMDGAIILSRDARRILYANTQLLPDPNISSLEAGIRHRTAERMARQTDELVIAISERRNIITLYQGPDRYLLQDVGLVLTKANQALQTLERYRSVLDRSLDHLTVLELQDCVTMGEVVVVLQRTEVVSRIEREIERYVTELGTEGRLVAMQLEELAGGVDEEALTLIKDYSARPAERGIQDMQKQLRGATTGDLSDPLFVSKVLGWGGSLGILEQPVSPRGYRALKKIPRLPPAVIENLVSTFGVLPRILEASVESLDEVDGIGEVRARAIKEGLRRLRDELVQARRGQEPGVMRSREIKDPQG